VLSITSLIMLAALVLVPALVLVAWVGLLFHRVLRLPTNQQKHGVTVLKQLTALVRAGIKARSTNCQSTQRHLPRAKGSQNKGRS
jgi:hypothetical protein